MKPSMRAFERFAKITLHRYERYLPTAFDESLTLLEKMNKLIEYLNAMGVQLGDVVDQWNEVMEWIINDGINDVVLDRLDEMVQDGTLESLINETVLEGINDKVDTISSRVDDVSDDVVDILDRYETESVELLVPSQFPSIISAINYATSKHKTANVIFEVIVESGHEITSPTSLSNGDYSHIRLSSQDDVVPVSSAFNTSNNVFQFTNATAPTFNMLVDGRGHCNMGVAVMDNSRIRFTIGSGFVNAGSNNLYVRNASSARATGGIFNGAGKSDMSSAGITAWGGSSVSANGAQANDCGGYGVRCAHGSILEFDYGSADNARYHGIRATKGGMVSCQNATARNCINHGIYALDASLINARITDVSGSGSIGYFANNASTIHAASGIANGCNIGVAARNGSTLTFRGGTANDCGEFGIQVSGTSNVQARNCEISGTDGTGVRVEEHGHINMQNSYVYGSRVDGIRVSAMSTINAAVCTIRNSGRHGVYAEGTSRVSLSSSTVWANGGQDIRVDIASQVMARNCRTTTNVGTDNRTPHLDDVNLTSFNTFHSMGYITT